MAEENQGLVVYDRWPAAQRQSNGAVIWTWTLGLSRDVDKDFNWDMSSADARVHVSSLGGGILSVRIEMMSPEDPLAIMLVARRALRTIDDRIGIEEIEGFPKSDWSWLR